MNHIKPINNITLWYKKYIKRFYFMVKSRHKEHHNFMDKIDIKQAIQYDHHITIMILLWYNFKNIKTT